MAGFGVMARPNSTPDGMDASTAHLLRQRMKIVREDQLDEKKKLDAQFSDDFISDFALAGTPAEVRERIVELQGLGISYLNVVFGSDYIDPTSIAAGRSDFLTGVLRTFEPAGISSAEPVLTQ